MGVSPPGRAGWGAAAALLPLVLAFVLFDGERPRAPRPVAAVLTVLHWDVLVRSGDGAFALATGRQEVAAGATVRTGPDGRGLLTYPDGSTTELGPGSELGVETLERSRRGDLVVELRQSLGRTWHVVARALSSGSRFVVRTPAATASVRGTTFEVAIAEDGTTTVTAVEGVVRVSSRRAVLEVGAGASARIGWEDAAE